LNADTEMGGQWPAFPTTRPSFVARLGSAEPAERAQAAEVLVRSYWKPVYKYLRLRFRKGNDDAKDLTQAFLVHALEKGWPGRYDPRRGRFRGFVRLALDGFVTNADAAARREKRGGGAAPLRLDFEGVEGELAGLEPPAPDSLDEWFEREWRRELFRAALADLERELDASGHARRLAIFRRYDLADEAAGPQPTYAELARQLGVEATTVTNELAAARRELRRILLDRLRAETTDEQDFREAVRALLGPDAP